MSFRHVIVLFCLAVVVGTLVYVANANHYQPLPDQYRTLDKSKPWNELARNFDPKMSDSEYDAMRQKYFDDVVAPKVHSPYSIAATREEFDSQTQRPWVWNRRPSRGEPPLIIKFLFVISLVYLIFEFLKWIWLRLLCPSGALLHEQGLIGMGKVILHGQRAKR